MLKKKYQTVLTLLILGILSYIINLSFNIFISHIIPSDLYGDFSIAIRSIFILSLLLLLGTNISSVKYLSQYIDNNPNNSSVFIRWNLKLIAKTFIFYSLILLIFYSFLFLLHFLSIHSFNDNHYFIYFLWLTPFSAFYLLLACLVLSNKQNSLAFFINKMIMSIFLIIFIFFTTKIFNVTIKLTHLVLFMTLTFFLIIIIELFITKKILTRHKINILKKKDINIDNTKHKRWLSDSLRLTPVQLIFNLVCFFDLLIIEIIHPNEDAVGYYVAMLTIANILWVIPSSVTSFFAPLLSPLLEKKWYQEIQGLIDTANYINVPISILLLIFIVIFSNNILSLFGNTHQTAQIPLLILSAAYFIGAAAFANARILTFYDSKVTMTINIFELILLIVTSLILTYYFGLLGMSIAVLFSISSKTGLMYFYVKQKLPIKPFTVF